MEEETKEEYIARHRREIGKAGPETPEEPAAEQPSTLRQRLNSIFFFVLCLLFMWMLYSVFGMMKSN